MASEIAGIVIATIGGIVAAAPDLVNRMTTQQVYWPSFWDRLHASRDEAIVSRYRRGGITIICIGAAISIFGIAS